MSYEKLKSGLTIRENRQHLESIRDDLRRELEGDQDERKTQFLRGRIFELNQLLDLKE